MRKIELVKGIHSSVLGFGCAPVMGSVGADTATKALDYAMELGVNHLDIARSYGYGEAESFVGNLINGRRNQIILASKFGIKANWKAGIIKPLKPFLRMIRNKSVNHSRKIENVEIGKIIQPADHFHDRIILNEKEMRKSLEKSLKALKTHYLDYFFIHEPHHSIINIDDLLNTAEMLKNEGKIRAFGLAFMRSQQDLHSAYLDKFDIVQFDSSPGAYRYEESVKERGGESNILFSPFKGGSDAMVAGDKLIRLNKDYPRSIILCSMFNLDHIRSNVKIFES